LVWTSHFSLSSSARIQDAFRSARTFFCASARQRDIDVARGIKPFAERMLRGDSVDGRIAC
jgi:hypothetical protein